MGELLITVAVCITQLALCLMGVYVSLKPPPKEQHRAWIAAFALVGLMGIVLTAWLAKRAGDAQARANTEIHNAQVAATAANSAATNANAAATTASKAATEAEHETKAARLESNQANTNLQALVNQRSKETTTAITRWQQDTESAVGKLVRSPRTLAAVQRQKLVTTLKGFDLKGVTIAVRHNPGCDECESFADQLADAIRSGGVTINPIPQALIQMRESHGVWVMIQDAKQIPKGADELVKALNASGIKTGGLAVAALRGGSIDLVVGLPE